ncbi:MAG: hypothetical protein H0T66_19945 [Geodermatophilaceae bacterium]|nr:hypothetical protein [Geodermatophilaceae bacterium]
MDENLPAESIVPIALVLDERTGYTLWAPPWEEDGEEWQAFLGSGGKINLFTSPAQLAHYLTTDVEHDLTDHPAYDAVEGASRRELTPTEDYVFDLDGLYDLVAAGPDRWSVGELADTIDMVERMAECCEVDAVEEHLGAIPGLGLLDDGHVAFVTRGGDAVWTDLAAGLGEHWEPVLEALGGALTWVTPVELAEDEVEEDDEDDTTADSELESEADFDADEVVDDVVGATALSGGELVGAEAAADARAAAEFWESVGILPVQLRFAESTGLTLRCYVEDSARFLGSELTVDVFRSAEGLSEFVEEGEPHDLTGLATWGAVVEADADPIPGELDRYDFELASNILAGTADEWDLAPLAACAEAALDLAEYCELPRVMELLGPDTELGQAVAAGQSDDDDERPEPAKVAQLSEQWEAVVSEIVTCLRWHD